MNDPILQTIANSLPPEYRAFIESGYIDAIAQKLGNEYQIEQPDVVVLRNGFMLYLYFVLLASELPGFLMEEAGLTETTASALTKDFLGDLPAQFTSEHTRTVEELRKEPIDTSTQDELLRRDPPPPQS
jgi:hypothetical protein